MQVQDYVIFVKRNIRMSLEEKWKKLGAEDQLFVEQIINQLLDLKDFSFDGQEYRSQLDILEKMKQEPQVYSRDAFQLIRELKAKIGNDQD